MKRQQSKRKAEKVKSRGARRKANKRLQQMNRAFEKATRAQG